MAFVTIFSLDRLVCPNDFRVASPTNSTPLDNHVHIVLVSGNAKRAGRSIDEHARTAFRTTANGLHFAAALGGLAPTVVSPAATTSS